MKLQARLFSDDGVIWQKDFSNEIEALAYMTKVEGVIETYDPDKRWMLFKLWLMSPDEIDDDLENDTAE
jgi:hypothetical protein